MSQLRRRCGFREAATVASLFVYLAVASCVNLLHTEECPAAADETAPLSDSCPACKYLAGANAPEVVPDPSPAVMEYQIVVSAAPDSLAIPSRYWTSSIIERGPPSMATA
jgi:hypothetical protein